MSYIRSTGGPGDIAALPPTFGLSLPPTIGASSAMRNIPSKAPTPEPIPSFMEGCMGGCMGEEGIIEAARPYLLPVALGAAAYFIWTKIK